MKKVTYLDNNATTAVDPAVFEEMRPFFMERYGNPSSMHSFGGSVGAKMREARDRVAGALGCQPDEIVFTSCGTESDNAAIVSALESLPGRRRLVTTRVEHPAVLSLAKHLEKKGVDLVLLGVDGQGRLDLDEVREAVTDQTAIVSVMHANNETGVVFPLKEVAEIAKAKGALVHTDAVQTVGKLPMDLAKTPVDFLALSGHKLHAPKGVGALYVRRGTPFRPLLIGGHQEKGRRAGTENATGIIALGKACELGKTHLDDENTRVKGLRDRLESELLARIPGSRINGGEAERLPNTLNISFEFVEGEGILLRLDEHGICASSGSACTSGSLEPSHVLRAMGTPFTFAHGSIRFSLSRFNNDADVDLVIATLPPIIQELRSMSPYKEAHALPACTC